MESMWFYKKLFSFATVLSSFWVYWTFQPLHPTKGKRQTKYDDFHLFLHFVVCDVAENVRKLNRQCCLHPNTLRCFTVIHKGHAGQRREVIAAEVLHFTVYGTSTVVCAQVLTGVPCLQCTSLGTGFIMGIVITGKVGLGQVTIMSSRFIPSHKIIFLKQKISSLREEYIVLQSNTTLEICEWLSGKHHDNVNRI